MRLHPYLLAAGLILSAGAAVADTYYVAPKGAKLCATPDGSQGCPLATPLDALRIASGGDTVLLMDGDYDRIFLKDRSFGAPVTIASMNAKNARVDSIALVGKTSNLTFRNLSVWPSDPSTASGTRVDAGFATNLLFDGLDVRSAKDAANYPSWSAEQWAAWGSKGFQARGDNTTLQNSTFTGTSFGIVLMGGNGKAINNRVAGFSMDGMRILGDDSVVRGNLITDCVRINNNHPDGIQSWSQNGNPVKNMLIEGNAIIEWSSQIQSPNRCRLQGIGFFDGFYDDIIIRNNVISTTAYHGISIYGGHRVQIINNTVVNGKGEQKSYPWIAIFNRKDGATSTDITISNNISMKYTQSKNPILRLVSTNNSVIISPSEKFINPAIFNYVPKPASGFIDTGNMTFAPKVDLRNYKRPAGKGPDRGAYETGSALVSGSGTTAAMALTN